MVAQGVHKPSSVPRVVTHTMVKIIHLGRLLPATSCDLPRSSNGPFSNASLYGLAPNGVYLAAPVTGNAGALLPHRFSLTQTVMFAMSYIWRILNGHTK